MLLKQHELLTCQWTHVNLICGLYEISYKPVCRKFLSLIVYVDDIVLTRNDDEEIQRLKKYLASEFEIKDFGNLKYFMGIKVARSRHGIILSLRKYVLDLFKETGMCSCKFVDNPIEQNKKLEEMDESSIG
jgi:hypothetical protein